MRLWEVLAALAILSFLLGFACFVFDNVTREARRAAWRREWPVTRTRVTQPRVPYDQDKDAA